MTTRDQAPTAKGPAARKETSRQAQRLIWIALSLGGIMRSRHSLNDGLVLGSMFSVRLQGRPFNPLAAAICR